MQFLGTIRGSGDLSIEGGTRVLGVVSFEIDSYLERGQPSANGRINGDPEALAIAFDARRARIGRVSAADLSIVLWDPAGAPEAEVRVIAPLPVL